MNILLVDDEPRILEGLERSMFEVGGDDWHFRSTEGGVAALEALEHEGPFDVIVTDMRMPGMDGNELLRRVVTQYPSMVRIVLTGFVQPEGAADAYRVAHRYLHKPCGPDVLKDAIESAVAGMQRTADERVRAAVGGIDALPPAPAIFLELRTLLSRPNASVDQAARLAERDPALAAKCLHLANSAFASRGSPARDIHQAIARIGLRALQAVAVSVGLEKTAARLPAIPGFDLAAFQRDAEDLGRIARRLARGAPWAQEAYAAGVIADVGTLVLALRWPTQLGAILRSDDVGLDERERGAFGATHPEVGALLLDLWGLPAPLVDAVATHHHPPSSSPPVTIADAVRWAVRARENHLPEPLAALLR